MDDDTSAFVDPDGYNRYLSESEKDFRQKLDQPKAASCGITMIARRASALKLAA